VDDALIFCDNGGPRPAVFLSDLEFFRESDKTDMLSSGAALDVPQD
jgi:hypothetical protein